MKKFIRIISVLTITCLMMGSLAGCDGDTKETEISTGAESETELLSESENETKPYFEETRAVVDVEVPSEVEDMRPIMLGLCKTMTGGDVYMSSDDVFFWEAIYSAINGNTWIHPNVSLSDDGVGYMVPKNVMEEYALAMFADADGLRDIPASIGGIEYVEDEESYLLYSAGGYVGSMDIVAVEETSSGYEVSVEFNTKKQSVENYTFIMITEAAGSFPCRIQGVVE